MKSVGFYDGKIIDKDQPVICIEDRGYQFGDGVYDAWMVLNGKHFLRTEHLARFERSCKMLDITPVYSREEIEKFSDEMLKQSGIERGMFYFQWTRGWQMPRNHVTAPDVRPILTGSIIPVAPKPPEYYTDGAKAMFYPDERQHFCHIKTLNLLGSVMASNAAAKAGCYEVIFVREEGGKKFVTESAHSNCYAVKDGVIHTAPLGNLILPGITRSVALDIAKKLGITVVEEFCSPEFFANADEVFVSAASGLVPIGYLDGKRVGKGAGDVFKRIDAEYQKLIENNK
ncbi:MAG TPA: aminotransferase class IV [Patescibacteria group bacterium]|nr:aminotransferase class IV [Patescibacteria group bacterium]